MKPNFFIQVVEWMLPVSLLLSLCFVLILMNFSFSIGGEYVPPHILKTQNFYLISITLLVILALLYVPIITVLKFYKPYTDTLKPYKLYLYIFANYIIVLALAILLIFVLDGLGLLVYLEGLVEATKQQYLINGYLLW